MTEGLSSSPAGVKRIPIRDRACTIGDLTGVNGYHVNRASLKLRFAEGGYVLQETPHFLLCTREAAPSTILVHWLAPSEIDADIGNLFMQELKPLGLLSDAKHFGHVFGVVVCSLFPHDPQHALRLYAANTLRRYRSLLEEAHTAVLSQSRPFTTLRRSISASLTCGSVNAFSTPGAPLASCRCSWLSASLF